MVRFLGIASLLLISHVAVVAAKAIIPRVDNPQLPRCGDPKASKLYDMQLPNSPAHLVHSEVQRQYVLPLRNLLL